MWLACWTQEEIATEVGYDRTAVSKFLDSLQDVKNGTGAEIHESSEKAALTETDADREFDEGDGIWSMTTSRRGPSGTRAVAPNAGV